MASYSTQPHSATSHRPKHPYTPTSQYVRIVFRSKPSCPPTNPSQHVSPSTPYYPPENLPPSAPVQPTANTPSYMSDEPPPYDHESVVTSHYNSQ